MSNCCDRFVMIEGEEDSFETWQGLRGPYYTPSVSEDGTLSWTNNGDLQNPAAVNLKGPPGEPGPPGAPGPGVPAGGTTGQLLAKASDEDFDTEWIDAPDMDAGGVTYDPTETYDDGTVGKELTTINSALSSLQSVTEIIDTASGAIASFPDGAGLPMRSLLATIEPKQDLHGYDAPWAAGAGANKWDEDWEVGDISSATGQNEGNDNLIRSKNYIPITGGSAYYAKVGTVTGNLRARFYDSSKTYIGYEDKSGAIVQCNASFTAPDNASYMRFAVPSGYGNTYNNDISINYPSTVTTYSPYANECPITGWTGLSGERDGKNLFDTATAGNEWVTSGGYITTKDSAKSVRLDCKAGEVFTLSNKNTASATNILVIACFDANNTMLSRDVVSSTTKSVTATVPNRASFLIACFNDWSLVDEAQLEVGSTATAYEAPVTSLPITASWQSEAGTVYGGTVDVVTGVLTVDRVCKTLTTARNLSGTYQGSIIYNSASAETSDANFAKPITCNRLKYVGASTSSADWKYGSCINANGTSFNLWIKDGAFANLAEATAWLGSNETQLCYYLAQPQTYQLTPQQISTLIGNNTVFVDCGSVSVTYQASIKGYIDKVLAS